MTLKFNGEFEEIKQKIEETGLKGDWSDSGQNKQF